LDGPSAMDVARRFHPNVCLLDVGLPGMDGYEVAQELRRARCLPDGARIIAVTGYGQDADRRRSTEAGFDGHLVKPVALDTLIRAIVQSGP
jgi:CheY-like chemotaxis protein